MRRLYSDNADLRTAQTMTTLGADSQTGTDFWYAHDNGKCRAIEVWTLESRETMRHARWSVSMV